jgi:ceramide glucosyltransferase
VFWFWFFVGPALGLAIFSLRGERKRARFVAGRLKPDPEGKAPPATVIVPLCGPRDGLRENLAALASLDYPNYELVVAALHAADIPPRVLPARVIVVLGGTKTGAATDGAQNLLAGVRASRKRTEILAFAGGCGRVTKSWLSSLVAALGEPGAAASTAYRWYLPEPPDFWSLMRSVWNAPIAGLLGPGGSPFAWSGAMAIRKETFFELRITEAWRRGLSEADAVTNAVHEARQTIAFAPGAMAACAGGVRASEFLRSAKHEMANARLSLPRLWWAALVAHFFYCGGMAAAVAASLRGSRGAEWALVVQLGLGMLKGVNRATLARAELPDYQAWFQRHAWVHALWVPLATWVWLWVLVSSAFDRGAGRDVKPSA